MSTNNRRKTDPEHILNSVSTNELISVLAKHFGLEDRKYELGIEFQIGVGPVGPSGNELVPGVVIGIKSVGLSLPKNNTNQPSSASDSSVVDGPPKRKRVKKDDKAK